MEQSKETRMERRSKLKGKPIAQIAILVVVVVAILGGITAYGLLSQSDNALTKQVKSLFNVAGDVKGAVVETHPVSAKVPAQNITVAIDGQKVRVLSDGTFIVKSITAGTHSVAISGNGYEALSARIKTTQGSNFETFKVCLTPEEAAKRWVQTKQANLHKATYTQLHPDDQAKVKQIDYIRYKEEIQDKLDIVIEKFTISHATNLKEWKHPVSGIVYRDVAKMKVDANFSVGGKVKMKKSWYIHAQKLKGCWRFFATGN